MSKLIVALPRLEVTDANAQPAWWFVAPPSPTAYVGFGQALTLRCLPPQAQQDFIGVGVVVHDFRLRAEKLPKTRVWMPHQHRSAALVNASDYSSKNKHALSLQPSVRCDLTVSLAIVFEEGAPVDLDKVRVFLRQARVAGGTLAHDPIEPVFRESMAKFGSLVRTGFALHARQDLMLPADGQDALDALLHATAPTRQARAANPWLMPATLGYAAVTPIAERTWTRDGLPHAFAEPLVGLVQLRPLREAPVPVWEYRRQSRDVFLVAH